MATTPYNLILFQLTQITIRDWNRFIIGPAHTTSYHRFQLTQIPIRDWNGPVLTGELALQEFVFQLTQIPIRDWNNPGILGIGESYVPINLNPY